MEATTRKLISANLKKHGWRTESVHTALGTKLFETAVGMKEASVYLATFDYDPESANMLLEGVYYSEGRNILEPHAITIPKPAGADIIAQQVELFVKTAESVIADSYAARLLQLDAEQN